MTGKLLLMYWWICLIIHRTKLPLTMGVWSRGELEGKGDSCPLAGLGRLKFASFHKLFEINSIFFGVLGQKVLFCPSLGPLANFALPWKNVCGRPCLRQSVWLQRKFWCECMDLGKLRIPIRPRKARPFYKTLKKFWIFFKTCYYFPICPIAKLVRSHVVYGECIWYLDLSPNGSFRP